MATYGFLDILEEELDKNFPFDFEISWDKRNHAVEVSFLLEAQNAAGVEMVDEDGEVSSDDILFEQAEQYASIRQVKSFLSLKLSNLQVIQAWYQLKVKKDVDRTRKALKIARQKMDSSRMLRDEKRYYENLLAELEKEMLEGTEDGTRNF